MKYHFLIIHGNLNRIQEQVEVISLTRNISTYNGKPNIYSHVVIAKKDNYAFGENVLEAYVRPTLEIVLVKEPGCFHREFDDEFNLPLFRM